MLFSGNDKMVMKQNFNYYKMNLNYNLLYSSSSYNIISV